MCAIDKERLFKSLGTCVYYAWICVHFLRTFGYRLQLPCTSVPHHRESHARSVVAGRLEGGSTNLATEL